MGDWCGTANGYQAHVKGHTEPCGPCLEARKIYTRHRRFISGTHRDPFRCKECGSVFDEHACGLAVGLLASEEG